MRDGEPDGSASPRGGFGSAPGAAATAIEPGGEACRIIETVVSPFHCLYQDALHFHSESQLRLVRSEPEASRLARSALLLYIAAAEALVHQAAVELGRPELVHLVADPARPLPLADAWRLLPAIVAEPGASGGIAADPEAPPWPQFAEMLDLRDRWAYPGPPAQRRAFYRESPADSSFEPLQPHQVHAGLAPTLAADRLQYPRTGLPRDPYALRPRHLDTARGVLDAAIQALDRRLGGALTRDQRHRREPVRVVHPPALGRGGTSTSR